MIATTITTSPARHCSPGCASNASSPSPVLVEVDHLLRRYTENESFTTVIDQVRRGTLVIEDLVAADYERAGVLLKTYADLKVGFVDCAVLAVTERLGESKLATLDHRHFGTMRPRHVEALELLPTAS